MTRIGSGAADHLDPIAASGGDVLVEKLSGDRAGGVFPHSDVARGEGFGDQSTQACVVGGIGVDDRSACFERVSFEIPQVGVTNARGEDCRVGRDRFDIGVAGHSPEAAAFVGVPHEAGRGPHLGHGVGTEWPWCTAAGRSDRAATSTTAESVVISAVLQVAGSFPIVDVVTFARMFGAEGDFVRDDRGVALREGVAQLRRQRTAFEGGKSGREVGGQRHAVARIACTCRRRLAPAVRGCARCRRSRRRGARRS